MKTALFRIVGVVIIISFFTGCFAAISGPDGGVIAAGAGPRRAGVVVDPPGPASVAVGTSAPRRRAYVAPASTVVVIPATAPRVVYRGRPAYFYRGNYYRKTRGGFVIIR